MFQTLSGLKFCQGMNLYNASLSATCILDSLMNCHALSGSWEAYTNQFFNTDKVSEMKNSGLLCKLSGKHDERWKYCFDRGMPL